MAGGISTYLQRKVLDHMIAGSARSYSMPSPCYLRLYTAAPDYDAGTGGTEKTGAGGYTTGGVAVNMTSTNWNAVASQGNGYRFTNKETSAFSWLASADWTSSIVGAALWDTNSGGNMLWGKNIDSSRLVYNGDTIRFASAAMKIDLDVTTDAGISNYWKQALLNHISGLAAYTAPTTAYIALMTANGNFRTMSYAGFTECVASDYARLSVTMDGTRWNAADTSGIVTNATAFNTWSAAVADWGTIVGAVLSDGATKGVGWTNAYCGASFTGVPTNPGDTFSIASGQWTVKVD